MKKSSYNYTYTKDNQTYLLLNTFTGAIAVIDSHEYELFRDMKLSEDQLMAYKEAGFVIEDDVDEFEIMKFDNTFNKTAVPARYRILTTTGCNANCFYCYEVRNEVFKIDDDTSRKIVEFIKKTNNNDKNVSIEWFGGEPLANFKAIVSITEALISEGYTIKSTMVSNGLLMSEDKLDYLISKDHLEKIQITVDGVEEKYEEIKAVPKGSFKALMQKMVMIADKGVSIQVRMNYKDNEEDLAELIDYFGKEIGFHHRILYYIYPIFDAVMMVPEETMDGVIRLNDKLVSNGLMHKEEMYKFTYRQTRCFASNFNGYTIYPDGRLFNCSHVMNEKGYVGDIDHYSLYHPKRLEFVNDEISEECRKCILYPNCKGGCRASELKLADLNQCILYKSCLDKVLEKILLYNT